MNKRQLSYGANGSFKIVQFTDVHWQNGEEEDVRSRRLMERIIQVEAPDLVVFTGDVIFSKDCLDPLQSFRDATHVAESEGIPWAAVYGNHDAEQGVTREQLMELQQGCQHSLSEPGYLTEDRVGNFVMTVHDQEGKARNTLYFLDSGSYGSADIGGYAALTRAQIQWYVEQSHAKERQHGRILPALAFFHIPLREYDELWEEHPCYGSKQEEVCSPQLNSGFFSAMVERRDVKGVFVGHDHINDFMGELHGIHLCYGRATGYNTYGKDGFLRGARVIQLQADAPYFDTWLRLEGGSIIRQQSEHLPRNKSQ